MKFTRILLTKNTRKFDEIISSARLSLNEAPQFFNELTVKKKEEVYDKLVKLNRWYMRVIGLDEVKHAQDKVMSIQEELNKTREKRREVETKLNDVNLSRSEIHNEMGKIDKNIDFHKFIELRNQETENLKLQSKLQQMNVHYKELEHEFITDLAVAIKYSNEKQWNYTEYTKYIWHALCLIGAFAAYYYRKEDIKRYKDLTLGEVNQNIEKIQENIEILTMKQNQPGLTSTVTNWLSWSFKYTTSCLGRTGGWVLSWIPSSNSIKSSNSQLDSFDQVNLNKSNTISQNKITKVETIKNNSKIKSNNNDTKDQRGYWDLTKRGTMLVATSIPGVSRYTGYSKKNE